MEWQLHGSLVEWAHPATEHELLLTSFRRADGGQPEKNSGWFLCRKLSQEMVALNTVNIRWWRRQIGFVGQVPTWRAVFVWHGPMIPLGPGQEPVLFNTTVRSNIMTLDAR